MPLIACVAIGIGIVALIVLAIVGAVKTLEILSD